MPEDLGSWSRAQAAVLVKVLKRAGCHPTASPGAGGQVTVTVPDDEAERANVAIAAEMDTIARAAREERERNVRSLDAARRRRDRRGGERPSRSTADGPPLATDRLRRLAPFLGLLLAALLVAALVPAAARFPAVIVAVLVLAYVIGRGRMGGGGGGGGGRRPAA